MQRRRVTLTPEKPDVPGPDVAGSEPPGSGLEAAAGGVSRPATRRQRLATGVAVAGIMVILTLSVLYLNRRAAAQALLTGWLDQRGISAQVSVERLELNGFVGQVRLGDPRNPDAVLERIEVDYALAMPWSSTGLGLRPDQIRLTKPTVRARLTQGRISFGALDPLIKDLTGPRPRTDSQGPVIVIDGARLNLATDSGDVVLFGDARVEDGRLVRLQAELPETGLEGGGIFGSGLAGRLDLRTVGDRIEVALEASADRLDLSGAPSTVLMAASPAGVPAGEPAGFLASESLRIRLSGALPYPDLNTRRLDHTASVQVRVDAARLSLPGVMMVEATSELGFNGHVEGWLEGFDLDGNARFLVTAAQMVSQGLEARSLRMVSGEVQSRVSRNDEGVQWRLAGPARVEARTAGTGAASGGGLGLEQLVINADELSAGGRNANWEVSGPAVFSAGHLAFGDLALKRVTGRSRLDVTQLDGILTVRAEAALRSQGGRWSLLGPVQADDVGEVAAMKTALGDFSVDFPALKLLSGSLGTEIVLVQPGRITPANGGFLTVRPGSRSLFSTPADTLGGTLGGGAFSLVATRGSGLPEATVDVPSWSLTKEGFEARLDGRAALDFDVARGLVLDTRGLLVSDRGVMTYAPDGCTAFTVQRLEFGENSAEALAGQLCPSGRSLFELENGDWRVDGQLKSLEALVPFLEARFEAVEGPLGVTGTQEGIGLKAGITSGLVLDTAAERRFHPLNAIGDVRLADETWAGDFEVLSGDYRVAWAVLEHDGDAGRGSVAFDTGDLVFNEPGLQPHDLTPLVVETMTSPVRGQVRFTGLFAWDEAQATGGSSRGQLTIPGLDFESPAGPVQGLKGQIDFTSLAPLTTAEGQTLSVDRLETITPLTALGLTFALDQATLKVAGGEIQAAGGLLKLEPLNVPLDGKQPFNGVLTLDRVQLGELIAGAGFGDRVALDAIVSGRLPFRWDPVSGVRVEAGNLTADQPGRLSIAREALTGLSAAGGGAEVPQGTVEDLAYQAMENLAFESLSADVNSLDAGRVGILFRIRGRHDPPEWQELRLSVQELISRSFLERKLPLPSNTGIDLTLDTSLNLNQLVNDLLAARRPREEDAADEATTVPVP